MSATAALIAAGLLMTRPSDAAVITGVSIADVSSQLTAFGRDAVHAIDGSGGVPTTSYTGNADNTATNMWLSTGNGIAGQGQDPHVAAADGTLAHIVFDLGAVYTVDTFHVWNYNESSASRSANAVTIRVSPTNTLTGLTPSGSFTTLGITNFTQANALASDPGTDYAMSFTARYVRIDITSTYGDPNSFTGLSEIRFDSVPEPASLGVLSTCGVLMIARYRRRA